MKNNRGSELGDFLERLATAIEEDRDELLRAMKHLGVARSKVKPALGLVAERLGRLKLNGRVTSYSPLSRVLELEGLTMGVTGKRAMWRALRELPALAGAGIDFDVLEQRANAQIDELEKRRVDAAKLAFG